MNLTIKQTVHRDRFLEDVVNEFYHNHTGFYNKHDAVMTNFKSANCWSIDLNKPATYHNYLHELHMATFARNYWDMSIPALYGTADHLPDTTKVKNELIIACLMHDHGHSQGVHADDKLNVAVAVRAIRDIRDILPASLCADEIERMVEYTMYPYTVDFEDDPSLDRVKYNLAYKIIRDADMSTMLVPNDMHRAYLYVGLYNEMTTHGRFTGTIDEFLEANDKFIANIKPNTLIFKERLNSEAFKNNQKTLRELINVYFGV